MSALGVKVGQCAFVAISTGAVQPLDDLLVSPIHYRTHAASQGEEPLKVACPLLYKRVRSPQIVVSS
jgi:hypothetical protein